MTKNYFSFSEIACPCCKVALLAEGFLDRMNELREKLGHPLLVNSMCRCAKHNAAVAGRSKSFHLINCKELTGLSGACAADISALGWSEEKRQKFIATVKEDGWSLGVARTFFHIDLRSFYPETGWPHQATWIYL